MIDLPPRLDGFFQALIAISNGEYEQGGLCVTFPAEFDRQMTKTGWSSVKLGSSRSAANFVKVDRSEVALFFSNALSFVDHAQPNSRLGLVDVLVDLLETELDTAKVEFWFSDEGSIQTLCIGMNIDSTEKWLQLFWSMD